MIMFSEAAHTIDFLLRAFNHYLLIVGLALIVLSLILNGTIGENLLTLTAGLAALKLTRKIIDYFIFLPRAVNACISEINKISAECDAIKHRIRAIHAQLDSHPAESIDLSVTTLEERERQFQKRYLSYKRISQKVQLDCERVQKFWAI